MAKSRATDTTLGFPSIEVTEYTDDEMTKQLISMATDATEAGFGQQMRYGTDGY